ncbi:CHASE2 domain-containing protein, partial [Cyanothece sp. BG0011]|uniref:CHASE2 domain-containing protein n=1 Tax=Cyanothece sp. BG0011 TaxID=2082950 RepID=UPI0013007856
MKKYYSLLFNYGKIIGVTFPVTALIMLLNMQGWLSTLELAIYDLFFQVRPLEEKDERIVIVGLEETEIPEYYPLTDLTLAKLIRKIKSQNPSIIGLDFYRDVSVGEGTEELTKVFQTTPNLFGVEKVIGDEKNRVQPNAILKEKGLTASSDVVVDTDGILRRGLITPIADGKSNLFSLGATLAIVHLKSKGITPQTVNNAIKLGDITFYPFSPHDGGYHNEDHGGYQVLLNIRNPENSFEFVSFSDVLNNQVSSNLFANRMVFIGATAPSIRDVFYTPFSRSLNRQPTTVYGVEIQANIASHIVSAVLDQRPIVKTLPSSLEYILIIVWGSLTTILLWSLRGFTNYLKLSLMIISINVLFIGILVGGSYFVFLEGWWIPIIPSFLVITGSSLLTTGLILLEKNREIENLLYELKLAQEEIIQEKKQAGLAKFVAGVAHEVNNPLTFINNFADLTLEASQKLQDEQEKYLEQLTTESRKKT